MSSFDIRNVVSNTKVVRYDVRQVVASTPVRVSFDIREIVSSVKSISFAIRKTVASGKSVAFDIRKLVFVELPVFFDIESVSLSDTFSRFELLQTLVFNGVELFWRDFSTEIDGLENYVILRRLENSTELEEVGIVPKTQLSFVDETVKGGRTYNYALAVELTGGARTTPSTEIIVKTIPDRVEGIDIIEGENYIDIFWEPTHIHGLSPTFKGYILYRAVDDEDFVVYDPRFLKQTRYRDNNVVSGRRYRYLVTVADNSLDGDDRYLLIEGKPTSHLVRYRLKK